MNDIPIIILISCLVLAIVLLCVVGLIPHTTKDYKMWVYFKSLSREEQEKAKKIIEEYEQLFKKAMRYKTYKQIAKKEKQIKRLEAKKDEIERKIMRKKL